VLFGTLSECGQASVSRPQFLKRRSTDETAAYRRKRSDGLTRKPRLLSFLSGTPPRPRSVT
jgi:hypothetical protein